MSRTHPLALALLCSLAAPAFAGTPINETRPLDANGTVEIENVKGRIEVRVWDRNAVQITGTLGKGAERLVVEGGGGHLQVEAKYPERGGWRGNSSEPSTLLLKVPLRASLEIESVAATVDLSGVAPRELDIDSVSGNVAVAGAPGKASISTVSGNQRLTLNTAGEVDVESVSGDIQLRGRLKGEVEAETVSGNIDIDSSGEALRKLSLNSVSGDAGARAALANGGEIGGETVSGDITLRLSGNLSARVTAESFSGDLQAPGAEVVKEEFGPGKSLNHRYGSGAGQIRIETFSGDFRLTTD